MKEWNARTNAQALSAAKNARELLFNARENTLSIKLDSHTEVREALRKAARHRDLIDSTLHQGILKRLSGDADVKKPIQLIDSRTYWKIIAALEYMERHLSELERLAIYRANTSSLYTHI